MTIRSNTNSPSQMTVSGVVPRCKHGHTKDAAYWHAWQEGRAYGRYERRSAQPFGSTLRNCWTILRNRIYDARRTP